MSRSTRVQMQVDLVTALKRGDVVAVSVLRNTLAALSNVEAVDPSSQAARIRAGLFGHVERCFLSSDDELSIVAREQASSTPQPPCSTVPGGSRKRPAAGPPPPSSTLTWPPDAEGPGLS